MAVFRIYVEKKSAVSEEANRLCADLKENSGVKNLEKVRLIHRYDVEGISQEAFDRLRWVVFAEPQLDNTYEHLPDGGENRFAVEALPGQFDQRADSCAQCIQFVTAQERPLVHYACVYLLYGNLTQDELASVKKSVINPVESREAAFDRFTTLQMTYAIPEKVETLEGFLTLSKEELEEMRTSMGLAMDLDDLIFCQTYFKSEDRAPTVTEIRMIDTYWSDHCRHTTFLTNLEKIEIEDKVVRAAFDRYLEMRRETGRTQKPINLMDVATIGGRYLKKTGLLQNLDESEEINACSVVIDVETEKGTEKWLCQFKNETHNHPTEIEPFGGAATCIGGAIRDPLSGRAYVYQAMRVTGAADPLQKETLPGKLPQRKLVRTAAAGYSSYGNQIGLATGLVQEIYHPGYVAKHLEIGAVVGAAPVSHVHRLEPVSGDVVILLGGRTGRDGCGGATGSSKSHSVQSLAECGAEVQKGNAPEERKLQRLFRMGEVTRMIKRCNDFGAGGVSVAIGELADGLTIDLNAVPRKYDGLDGTELAISESQERMAVVVDKDDVASFLTYAHAENIEATPVARVTEEKRLTMHWNGNVIVDVSRDFLSSNGAPKKADVQVEKGENFVSPFTGDFASRYVEMVSDLNICSQKGLSERFDSTIGSGSVLMPFGGKYQLTPMQMMAAKIPVLHGDTKTVSCMAYGFQPYKMEKSPFVGAYYSVLDSVCKLIAGGAVREKAYLTLQEYFQSMTQDAKVWGKPFGALLGALRAQDDLQVAAIGGKDSMSGSFESIHVPPTLVSFAISFTDVEHVLSGEFKKAGSRVAVFAPEYEETGLPNTESMRKTMQEVQDLVQSGKVLSAYTVSLGGLAEAVFKMGLGNGLGFAFADTFALDQLFAPDYGTFVLEMASDAPLCGKTLGYTLEAAEISYKGEKLSFAALQNAYEEKLESVFPYHPKTSGEVETLSYKAESWPSLAKQTKPRVLIPVFPGTNCEYDSARAVERAGMQPEFLVVRNLRPSDISESIDRMAEAIQRSDMIFMPGGFSGGDEPEGSGKFILSFFRTGKVTDAVHELLHTRKGLMLGICNGFQALIKLGLLPYGYIRDTDENCPTLTFNAIGRHQSMLVRTRVASNKSPFLQFSQVGDVLTVPISHGEGRFIAPDTVLADLIQNGQIATQYVDLDGKPTMDIRYNPNHSLCAVEGITSLDGRILGKMGHSERYSEGIYKNVEGKKENGILLGAAAYFR